MKTSTKRTPPSRWIGHPLWKHIWTIALLLFLTGCGRSLVEFISFGTPEVISTSPVNGATGIRRNTTVSATFSEAMDSRTFNRTTFTLRRGVVSVSGRVSYAGTTANFSPSVDLAANTTYTARITTGAKDSEGNALASTFTWSFTTGTTPDEILPLVSATTPLPNATAVPLNTLLTATFSETMDPATLTNATFTLKRGGTEVSGDVSYIGITATFSPASNLVANTKYTATISASVTDNAGNELPAAYTWTFETGGTPDTTAPLLSATTPLPNALAVAFNAPITATFSEVMDPLTITTANFSLSDGTSDISGTVIYTGVTAIFTPTNSLDPATNYTATVTTGVKDLAGNALADVFTWSYTTGATPDTTLPLVSSTTPLNNALAVAINAPIAATFSEAMDPVTVSTTSFTVFNGVTSVPGTVLYVGVTAIFTPLGSLDPSTLYRAVISPGVTDLAGNALADPYEWTFTTGITEDVVAPLISASTPFPAAVGVAFNAPITVTFSEVMNPLTVTTATFRLQDGPTVVLGTVLYSGVTAVFTPTTNLSANTSYTATIATGVRDLAGNQLDSTYVWNFTTGSTPDISQPLVSSTFPFNNAVGVAFNAPISATFSEGMNPLTLTTATFNMLDAELAPVLGTVMYVGLTAIFTPNAVLEQNTLYTASISFAASDLAGNALAGDVDYEWSFTTGVALDTTAPLVSFTAPLNGAIGVAFNAPITALFSEVMNPLTLTTATFRVFDGPIPVPGTVLYVGLTALFTPLASLDPSTIYKVTIGVGAQDLAGNSLPAEYNWSFTTGAAPDTLRPQVSSSTPLNSAINVAFNAPITATFSEVMNPLTVNTATFTLLDGVLPVSGTVMYVGVTAIFTPTEPLEANTLYTASISTSVADLPGNFLENTSTWSFTTGAAPDETPPLVSATTPDNGAGAVAFNAPITAVFSEVMNPLTITALTFTLFNGATAVSGAVTYVGVTALFTPTVSLAPNTQYTAAITPTVTDLAGNAMTAVYSWTFTTGPTPDTTQPLVSATTPANGATGVAFNAPMIATFSEVMNPLTITTVNFTLHDGPLPVLGAVSYVGVTVLFTPTNNLNPDTLYTATITNAAQDLAGNPLAATYVWTFTTGPVPDTLAPSVTFTAPVDDATGVAVGGDIVAVFSEAMDPLTITSVNFSVQQTNQPVVGTITYSNVTATFHPTIPLDPNTTYSASITTAAEDLAGNALADNYVWNFTTGATPDTTPPTVISTIPADGAIDVALNANVSATFDEVMDPLTLTTATFTLLDGLIPVVGAVTIIGATAIFDPANTLDPNTEYTAILESDVADLAGNAMLADFTWSFTTGGIPDTTPPTVVLVNPADDATEVALNATVNATFSEAMDPLTLTTATITVTGPGATVVPGTVLYDAPSFIVTFTPDDDLLQDAVFTATVTTGAKDLAGNALAANFEWTFSTAATFLGEIPVDLASLSTFVAVAGSGLTNSNSSGTTTLNGDVGLSPTGTCLGDGIACSITNPVVNGTLYINDPEGVAAQAKTDLTAAYVDATSRPVGTTVNDISGMVLAPGVYTSNSTMSIAVGGTVTLDGQGDTSSVWIFQIGSSLTVNNNAQVLLINGAKAKNVFWAVFASSTLGSTVSFQGNVLAGASNSVGTDSTVVGRLLCRTGQITLLSNTITLPPF